MDTKERSGDMVLNPNEFAWVGDKTDGKIITCVGPIKRGLQDTEVPKIWDAKDKRFITTEQSNAVQKMIIAPKGWYIIVKNPPVDGQQPKEGKANETQGIQVGIKVNIPGPTNFALWPGQMTKVVEGHHLRTNQYLLCRVYDEEAAIKNWDNAIVSKQKDTPKDTHSEDIYEDTDSVEILKIDKIDEIDVDISEIPNLVNGQRLIVKGTDVSFYIPPTGVEIISDENGNFVRDAVTLERLEYCILRNEDGNKRYVRGPETVFPTPTEIFLKDDAHNKKFRAIELNEITGIYIKVIAPYKDENSGRHYKEGDELFITGKEQMIYFPRQEHSIIRYDSQEKHFAVAIPSGSGRYVMNRLNGHIEIQEGPSMALLDPRKEVFIRRILPSKDVKLWFGTDDNDALLYNEKLTKLSDPNDDFVSERRAIKKTSVKKSLSFKSGDDFARSSEHTKPRQITIDDRFQGAVCIELWPGYAAQIVSKTGKRETIVGPTTRLLEYDESLATFKLSTGAVKSVDKIKNDSYLKVLANKVSDQITIETEDLYEARIKVSYRVKFLEEHKDLWFNVDNYVQFAIDDLRSRLKANAKSVGIEEFYTGGIDIIRDCVLGRKNDKDGGRPGRFFEENGMLIYDVDVLDIEIMDGDIEYMLKEYKTSIVQGCLDVKKKSKELENTKLLQMHQREITSEKTKTEIDSLKKTKNLQDEHDKNTLAIVESEAKRSKKELDGRQAEQEVLDIIAGSENKRSEAKNKLFEMSKKALADIEVNKAKGMSEAKAIEISAIQPEFIAAIESAAHASMFATSAEHIAPVALLKQLTVGGVVEDLFNGSSAGNVLKKLNDNTQI